MGEPARDRRLEMVGKGMRRHRLIVYCLLLAGAAANAASDTRDYFGADLSSVNELEHCGAAYSFQGKKRDLFELLHERGANLARVRLWNDAPWTQEPQTFNGITYAVSVPANGSGGSISALK